MITFQPFYHLWVNRLSSLWRKYWLHFSLYIYIYIYIYMYIYILYIIYLILYIWYIYILLFFFLYYSSQNLIPCEVFTAHSKPGKENVNLAQQVNHDCCKQVIDTSTSQSYQTQQLYNIFHKLNCKSKLSFT